MNPIALPILYANAQCEDLAIPVKYEDCELGERYFYVIDNIGEVNESLTEIVSSSITYYCPWNVDKVISEISKWKISNGGYN